MSSSSPLDNDSSRPAPDFSQPESVAKDADADRPLVAAIDEEVRGFPTTTAASTAAIQAHPRTKQRSRSEVLVLPHILHSPEVPEQRSSQPEDTAAAATADIRQGFLLAQVQEATSMVFPQSPRRSADLQGSTAELLDSLSESSVEVEEEAEDRDAQEHSDDLDTHSNADVLHAVENDRLLDTSSNADDLSRSVTPMQVLGGPNEEGEQEEEAASVTPIPFPDRKVAAGDGLPQSRFSRESASTEATLSPETPDPESPNYNQISPISSQQPVDTVENQTTSKPTQSYGFYSFVRNYLRAEVQSVTSVELAEDPALVAVGRERVSNFLSVPVEIERLMLFGFFVCLDSFLHMFTLFPFRVMVAVYSLLRSVLQRSAPAVHAEQRRDLVKAVLLFTCCYLLTILDASRLYHSIRGQAVIKLYVIFNVLEIGDRLCCSFGQDILESLFFRISNGYARHETYTFLRPIPHFLLALLYVFGHTLVLFYQMVTLNVAINSHNNALLTLLISNQFVEIKGNVFKKFEKENLFQLTCSDIVERFQITIFLAIITGRNLLELTQDSLWWENLTVVKLGNAILTSDLASVWKWTTWQSLAGIVYQTLLFPLDALVSLPFALFDFLVVEAPQAFYSAVSHPFTATIDINSYFSRFEILVLPVLVVLGSEVIVDWLKHAFITKFNHIRPTVYQRYLDILCKDLVLGRTKVDSSSANEVKNDAVTILHSSAVSRRIGFATLPLACLVIRIFMQAFLALPISTCPMHALVNTTQMAAFSTDFVLSYLSSVPSEATLTTPVDPPKSAFSKANDAVLTKWLAPQLMSPREPAVFFANQQRTQWWMSVFSMGSSLLVSVACACYYLALFSAGFLLLFGIKCVFGYHLARYARIRYSASRSMKSSTTSSSAANLTSPGGSRGRPSPLAEDAAIPKHNRLQTLKHAYSVPNSPGSYVLLRKDASTMSMSSPLHRENSTVMMDDMYGKEDANLVGTRDELSASSRARPLPSPDQFRVPNAHDDGLQKEESDYIGTIKMQQPQEALSLENIDRYTLFKSRIP